MKNPIYLLPLFLVLACGGNQEAEVETQVMEENQMESGATKPDSVLRHTVFFSFKETSSPEDVKAIVDAFRNLQNEIDGIESFEWGVNSSPEGLNQGLTHAFTLTFHSDAARDAYLPHPAHQEFGALLGPHLDKVLVVDYWTRE